VNKINNRDEDEGKKISWNNEMHSVIIVLVHITLHRTTSFYLREIIIHARIHSKRDENRFEKKKHRPPSNRV
jgi:hypothetical protein